MKVANSASPEIMHEIFQPRRESSNNLRYTSECIFSPIDSAYHLNESVSYAEPKICELIPSVIRRINTLYGFKKAK